MTFNRKGLGLYVDLSVTKMILGFGLHSVAAAGRHSARCCSAETGDWSDGTVLESGAAVAAHPPMVRLHQPRTLVDTPPTPRL